MKSVSSRGLQTRQIFVFEMRLRIECLTRLTFVSIIIIASDLIGPNDTARTNFRRTIRRRQDMEEMPEMQPQIPMEMEEVQNTTEEVALLMQMDIDSAIMTSMSMNTTSDTVSDLESGSNVNVISDESRDTRGIRGFLPGFNLGGGNRGNSGGGLFRGLKPGGGLLRGFGLGGKGLGGGSTTGENNNFPEFPESGGGNSNNGNGGNSNSGNEGGGSGWSQNDVSSTPSGWSQSSGSSSGGKGLFSSFPGASLFRNPFGGGKGGREKGRGGLRLFSKLNQDKPCAAGLSTFPILSKLPFIPNKRFPSFIPSGVNTCDATCDSGPGGGVWRLVPPTKEEQDQMGMDDEETVCTYNWRDSLMGLPFLLFRCQCKKKCPPKRVRIGGIFSAHCENVSGMKTRCSKCPYGQESFKCTLTILPVAVPFIQRTKPYYCTCCNENATQPLGLSPGGYDLNPAQNPKSPSPMTPMVQEIQETISTVETIGGYGYGGANPVMEPGGTSSTRNIVQREPPKGRPLGSEHFYEHL